MGKRGQGVDDDRSEEERVANGSNSDKNKKEVDLDPLRTRRGEAAPAPELRGDDDQQQGG